MPNSKKWYAVTYRGTAEMVVWVEAKSANDAKDMAELGQYDDATAVEFVKGKPYTMKARLAPDHVPGDDYAA